MTINIADLGAVNKTVELVGSRNFGTEADPVFFSAEIELHAGDDYTVYLVEEDGEAPTRFHAIYNDFEAFEQLLNEWESDEVWAPDVLRAEIEELKDQFNTAVQAGHGSWHRGTVWMQIHAKKVGA